MINSRKAQTNSLRYKSTQTNSLRYKSTQTNSLWYKRENIYQKQYYNQSLTANSQ